MQHLQDHPPRRLRGFTDVRERGNCTTEEAFLRRGKQAGGRLRSKIEHAVVTLVLAQFHSSSATVDKMD